MGAFKKGKEIIVGEGEMICPLQIFAGLVFEMIY